MKQPIFALASLLAASAAAAQDHDHGESMSGMDHATMQQPAANAGTARNDIIIADQRIVFSIAGSGTARLPGFESAMHGLHLTSGDWMVMAHGQITANHSDHKGPRGDALTYATSMAMLSVERSTDWGRIQLKSMASLEPLMDARGYPNLFATGETAHGQPLVDRQHPHDLFMELAARIDINAGSAKLFLYGGPVGEPALGPSAFMHRGSAANNPEPPISHHWFDSTHISYGVATIGYASPHWQIETSAFRGAEPDEHRWNIEAPRLDSWSVRATWSPNPHWTAQLSHGFIKQPEATHPGENEHRTTASVHYADQRLSAMISFAAKDRSPGETLTAWLAEANVDLTDHHSLFGRIEHVANDELVPDHHDPRHDVTFQLTKAQLGYAWHHRIGDSPLHLTLGGSANLYGKPAALDGLYGRNPWGYTLFARLSLGH